MEKENLAAEMILNLMCAPISTDEPEETDFTEEAAENERFIETMLEKETM